MGRIRQFSARQADMVPQQQGREMAVLRLGDADSSPVDLVAIHRIDFTFILNIYQ